MAKTKTVFYCTNCGNETPKWMGRCPSCGAYNTMEEHVEKPVAAGKAKSAPVGMSRKPQRIREITSDGEIRFSTGMGELDRVLGGGAVAGSLVLVGGAPGIGKSTLLLQICSSLCVGRRVLYVSGEESERQLKLRAERLGVAPEELFILSETRLSDIVDAAEAMKPDILIVDSIQTLYNEENESSPGSVSQVKDCTMTMMQLSKSQGITVFVVGHINKDGNIAGPKVLEHMVDCVLYFEGDQHTSYRILTDSSLQANLAIIKDASPGTLTWIEAERNIASRAAHYSLWFSNTVSFQLRTSRGTTYSHFFRASSGANELTDERMAAAACRQGRFIWLTEENGDASRLFLVREIREMENITLDNLGYMLIEVDFPSLVEQYSQAMGSLGVEPRCAVYNKGICLYASDDGIRALGMGEDGYTYTRSDGKPALCGRCTATNGLKYVTLVDYSGIRTTTLAAVSVTILCILGAALLVVAVSTGLINSILVHFQVLMQKFDAFAVSGEPISTQKSACYKDRFDEIGDLHRGFDWMTREQMQQLRAQVRPHFLYNTLESIYCLAQNSGDKRIAVMTSSLGKLLRASLNDKRDVVTVREDLQTVRDYLSIQEIRYGERLQVEYAVDDAVMPCHIPAMTVQPLVENAIHHAAEHMLDTCIIRISGNVVPDGIDVIVQDNGPGIDEDILTKLESGEVQPEGLGIGLRNIHKRVQHTFGKEYGLRIRCEDGCTQIIIHLPDTRPEKPETPRADSSTPRGTGEKKGEHRVQTVIGR